MQGALNATIGAHQAACLSTPCINTTKSKVKIGTCAYPRVLYPDLQGQAANVAKVEKYTKNKVKENMEYNSTLDRSMLNIRIDKYFRLEQKQMHRVCPCISERAYTQSGLTNEYSMENLYMYLVNLLGADRNGIATKGQVILPLLVGHLRLEQKFQLKTSVTQLY
ncbi:hypothetical protein CHS0354_020749 [Potamilus streckersoni]|uniref:Uncharacterized protein n=1 Tax=Potamilus streckersoni TaxID=2493646 RepID=A0AAE0SDN6_9BIVA|nr:hypothetical protein CHS0354_020749 [Potamilus streckersoni]